MNYPVPDLRSYLLGSWRVQRTLLNRADSSLGTFTGTAVFLPLAGDTGALRWQEEGTVRWAAAETPGPGRAPGLSFTGPARREYLLVPGETAGPWEVLFEDGRAFHPLDLAGGTWTADHWCSPDSYRVRFVVLSQDRLTYEWDVTGPAKDQLLTTELTRCAAGS